MKEMREAGKGGGKDVKGREVKEVKGDDYGRKKG